MSNFLFSTGSNPHLVKAFKKSPCLKFGSCIIGRYQDGEIMIHINEKIIGKKIYVLGSSFPPADNILKLIILINALKENGAKEITLLLPYFGYGKQDRMKHAGDAMSAKLMANVLKLAGAAKIITLDLHNYRVKKYFTNGLIHLSAIPLFAGFFAKMIKDKKNWLIVSPDRGGIARAKELAGFLKQKNIIIIEKTRPKIDKTKVIKIRGDVKNKNLIMVDDMCQTGETLITAAEALERAGAKNIYVAVTHLLPTGPAIRNLKKDKNIKKIIFTDSTNIPQKLINHKKFTIISAANLFLTYIK